MCADQAQVLLPEEWGRVGESPRMLQCSAIIHCRLVFDAYP